MAPTEIFAWVWPGSAELRNHFRLAQMSRIDFEYEARTGRHGQLTILDGLIFNLNSKLQRFPPRRVRDAIPLGAPPPG